MPTPGWPKRILCSASHGFLVQTVPTYSALGGLLKLISVPSKPWHTAQIGLEEGGAAGGVAARQPGLAVDIAVQVDLPAAEEQGQLLHGRMGHHLDVEAVGLVHDDVVNFLEASMPDTPRTLLDPGIVGARAVGAVGAPCNPSRGIPCSARCRRTRLRRRWRGRRVGRLGLVRLEDGHPVVVRAGRRGRWPRFRSGRGRGRPHPPAPTPRAVRPRRTAARTASERTRDEGRQAVSIIVHAHLVMVLGQNGESVVFQRRGSLIHVKAGPARASTGCGTLFRPNMPIMLKAFSRISAPVPRQPWSPHAFHVHQVASDRHIFDPDRASLGTVRDSHLPEWGTQRRSPTPSIAGFNPSSWTDELRQSSDDLTRMARHLRCHGRREIRQVLPGDPRYPDTAWRRGPCTTTCVYWDLPGTGRPEADRIRQARGPSVA